MKPHIRKASADDYDHVCELFQEVDTLHRENLPLIFQKPEGAVREREYYLGLVADKNAALFVAEMNEELIGFVRMVVRDTPNHPVMIPHHYAVIDEIAVKSEFQDRGVGNMLMEKAQAWAASSGAAYMELNVYEFNRNAISFYEGLGYKSISRKMRKEID